MTVHARIPEPARILVHLVAACAKITTHEATRLIHDGYVRVNKRPVTNRHQKLDEGDFLEVEAIKVPVRTTPGKVSQEPPTLIYEDSYLLVVNKPANLLTVPTPMRERVTLQSLMTKHIAKSEQGGQAYCVHRLDRGVSGLLVMAKQLTIAEKIRDQFAARKPARKYVAIVHGRLEEPSGTIRTYLTTDAQLNRYSVEDPAMGELAITHYQQLFELRNASIVQVQLETGRRNQIRVHMAEMGHAILGDPRYGGEQVHSAWPHRRLALHAESLGFEHPVTEEPLQFASAWPDEFRQFKRKMSQR